MPRARLVLETQGIVPRLDMALRHVDILVAVEIDAVRVSVQDGDALDVDTVAAEESDTVVAGVGDRQIADLDPVAGPERDRLRPLPVPAVAVDGARADDAKLPYLLRPCRRAKLWSEVSSSANVL